MIRYYCKTNGCENSAKQIDLWPTRLEWVGYKPHCVLCKGYVPQTWVSPKSHPDYEAGMDALFG